MNNAAFSYAWRRARRGWRSGEVLILMLALTVAVAAVSAVGLFTERVRDALEHQSGDALGADLIFSSRDPIPDAVARTVTSSGARSTGVVQFPSVVLNGEQTALASIKAVTQNYPVRGAVRITHEPFGAIEFANGVPAEGEAWVDLKLWTALNLKPGAVVRAGSAEFRVTALVDNEPDRGGSYLDFAPRFLINAASLPASRLLTAGSRAQYSLMMAGTDAQLSVLKAYSLPLGVRRVNPQDARPEVRSALNRAGQFLDIAVLAVTLLSAAAIALGAHQHGSRLRDEVALLKCLGARQNFIVAALSLNLLLLGLIAGACGALLGWGSQQVIAQLLAGVLDIQLPAPAWMPLLYAWGLGLLMLLGFAIPPILQARRSPPIRVFQRDVGDVGGTRLIPLISAATVAGLLWLQTGSPQLALTVALGTGVTVVLLALLAWLLVLGMAPLRRAVGVAWRFGLGNISRRRGATIAQAVALGMALQALLLITVVRQDLLATWQAKLPADTPNQFLINIQPEQREPLRRFFAARGYADLELVPMARARLTAINGKPIRAETFDDPETQRWINRDFNLSWADHLRADNKLTGGEVWTEADRGKPWLSVDKYVVERLHTQLGDRFTLDFAGTPIELTVRNTRTVQWDTFRPNFFLITPPGILDAVPQQWITSFYLPQQQRQLLRDLIIAFPNVTPLDIGATMAQVRTIMDRIIRAVEFIFLFTLAAGLTVLLAAIESTRDDRAREIGLMRALGASRRTILLGLLTEYAVLGLLAGTVAALSAQVVAWGLAIKVFNIPYGPRPLIWLAGALAGCAIVTLLGWLSLRRVLNTPPATVLRGSLA